MEMWTEWEMESSQSVLRVEGSDVRGRPSVMRENRVEEYRRERRRGGLDQERRECWNRENWRIFCHGHPLEESSRRE